MPVIRRDSEQSEFIHAFVDESREMLDQVEPLLIELEKRSDVSSKVDSEVLNTIFRLFHSLKGAAGFLELTTIGKVTHEAETLLDLFRKGESVLNSGHIDLLNRTTDFIRNLLNIIESELHDHGFEIEADAIILALKQAKGSLKNDIPGKMRPENVRKPENRIEIEIPTDKIKAAEPDTLKLEISPEMIKQYVSEAEELLETAESALMGFEKEPHNLDYISQAFRALHSFKGNSGFLGYSDLERVSHQVETVLDTIRAQKGESDGEALSLILEILDFLKSGVAEVAAGRPPKIMGADGLISLLKDAMPEATSSAPAPVISPSLCGLKIEFAPDEPPEPAGEKTSPASVALRTAGRIQFAAEDTVAAPQAPSTVEAPPESERRAGFDRRTGDDRRAAERAGAGHQSIRVDIEKLDILMDLVGELVIAEAMVAQNPDLVGMTGSLDRFERSVLQLNKITRDIQDAATSIRMITLSGSFRKMIRLVRDLSQKSGKKVELDIIGEETEVDKTVIEQINDPLVHIIRNSIDHGLETPDQRGAKGKSITGRVTLEAKYMGGEVWITIRDDGRGLDREKIISKARERGLLEGDGSGMRDEEVWQMIFLPGFSTADKITDVSGRGVGMDVVRRNIENIRGKVEVRSEKDRGSTVILKIPLTLAIIDGMITRVGKNLYIIPIIAIKESLKADRRYITRTMDGQEIINIRGQLIPIVRLSEIFEADSNCAELEDGILIIVEYEQKSLCLFVDEVIRQQQVVIKGLSNYVGNVGCVSGCTILGDGDISLILDIAGIMSLVEDGNGEHKKEGKRALEFKSS